MAVGRMVPIGKKSPMPPKLRPKQGILVAGHWGPPFSTLGVFLYAFVGLFRFWKQFSKNGQPGAPLKLSRVTENSSIILVLFS